VESSIEVFNAWLVPHRSKPLISFSMLSLPEDAHDGPALKYCPKRAVAFIVFHFALEYHD
jgi:hypothetical protein